MNPQSIWAMTPEAWIRHRAEWLRVGDVASVWFFARELADHGTIQAAMRRMVDAGEFEVFVDDEEYIHNDMWRKLK